MGQQEETRLAHALWSLVLEYGGNGQIDAINPHFRQASARAVSLLEQLGYYHEGKGFHISRLLPDASPQAR